MVEFVKIYLKKTLVYQLEILLDDIFKTYKKIVCFLFNLLELKRSDLIFL